MLYRFQVLYRLVAPAAGDGVSTLWPAVSSGPLLDQHVDAETPEAARSLVEGPGIMVHSVGPGQPILDPNQYTFTKEEAAVLFRAKTTYDAAPTLIDKMMAEGVLPRPRNGRPIFTRTMLDRALAKRMEDP